MKSHKLVITGLGHVGSQVLSDAMLMNLFGEIALIDTADGVALGEALDQFQATGVPGMPAVNVHEGDAEDYRDADVVICAAGPSILPIPGDPNGKPDRAGLAITNAAVVRQVMGDIASRTHDAIVIFITNPLDTMVYIAENEFGYPAGRVFGTGTMLDSSRLRQFIASVCRVSPASVTGYMMGEHGLSAFPVLSRVNVMGFGWDELPAIFPGIADVTPEIVRNAVVDAAYNVLNAKGWTNAGVAQSAMMLARAVLLDEQAIHPACTTLRGEYGYDGDVAFSMPSIIGRNGVEKRIPVTLNEWETEQLDKSVAAIKEAMSQAKAGLSD